MQCIDVAGEMYALVMCLWREVVIWAIYVFGKSAINSLAINTWKVEGEGWMGGRGGGGKRGGVGEMRGCKKTEPSEINACGKPCETNAIL